ncbi:unnamed protein product [Enterobius vermicularis]|uniref:Autophagy-related protein 101 n=1 Tax=Enterobius vermicularis TaxID=51028 RepID=A0A3P6HJJ1_ENTVE|nr:unnamed protein product [Enterobius vermicularis]
MRSYECSTSAFPVGAFLLISLELWQKHTLEIRQVRDAVSAVFHTLLLHRSMGKFNFKSENNYQVGSIGVEEVDCDSIDLTYVRVNSSKLVSYVQTEVDTFCYDLEKAVELPSTSRNLTSFPSCPYGVPLCSTKISLEFFQRRKRQWLMPEEEVPWEVWQLQLDIVSITENEYFTRMKEIVADSLSDIVLSTCGAINKPQYMPKIPTRSELMKVFDDSFPDCQPYLFRITKPTLGDRSDSAGLLGNLNFRSVKRLLKDTLSV